ncbi:hypothetical protein TSUD_27880 [Trifolium subterraneum]|uniref:Reverse transcriptase domain-containing protein n=1 Tax=Trifolium subterraneum TaxID=3900 RepID=A0A2Z6NII1_TRISU|nr:hypothetical protein TSUD_27880 [Trifolium subterraneum]
MRRAVAIDKFKGYQINNNLQFQILQFADDTILVGEDSWDNVQTIKTILRSYELVSGLKISFVKSKLYGLNVDTRLLVPGSIFLSCSAETIPFKFLGIPVGANPRRQETWKPVVEAMTNHLSLWKSRHLSFGGRVTLINLVLSSLPLYFFSFFKALSCIVKLLERIQRNFLWGGGVDDKKICWVKWDHICLPKAQGMVGEADNDWFKSHVKISIGNVVDVGLWNFTWFGNQSFSALYLSLYMKEFCRNVTVANRLGGFGDTGMISWQSDEPLTADEEHQEAELTELLYGFSLQPEEADGWRWIPETIGNFSVKSCYNVLLNNNQIAGMDPNVLSSINQLWKNDIPSEVLVFGWRLLLERLPTRIALHRRGV